MEPKTFQQLERQQKHEQDIKKAEDRVVAWQRIEKRLANLVKSLPSFPLDPDGAQRRLSNYHSYIQDTLDMALTAKLVGAKRILVPCLNEVISFREAQDDIDVAHMQFPTFKAALTKTREAHRRAETRHSAVTTDRDIKEIATEASYVEAEKLLLETKQQKQDVMLPDDADHGICRAPLIATIKGFSMLSAKRLGVKVESMAGYCMFRDQIMIGVSRAYARTQCAQTYELAEQQLAHYAALMKVKRLDLMSTVPTFLNSTYWFWAARPKEVITMIESTHSKNLQITSWGFAF